MREDAGMRYAFPSGIRRAASRSTHSAMLDHTGIFVSDLARSRQFYAAVLGALGYAVRKDVPQAVGFGDNIPGDDADPGGDFWLIEGGPATPRIHVAFRAPDRAAVDRFYAAAIAAGGRDNGRPGICPEYHPHYYAGFVFDPDGYNIEAVCHRPEGRRAAAPGGECRRQNGEW